MIQTISERVFKNGGITRKDINNVIDETLRNLDSYRGFQKVRDLVADFCKATRKRDRGAIIVALGAIGWNGIFDAGDIAKVLLDYEDRNRGVSLALDKLARWETDYKANMNDVKVLRLGAKQVLLKKWEVTFAVTARQIEMQVDDGAKTHFPVSVEETGNIYAFLKMLLLVRPMLMPRGIKFTMKTPEEDAESLVRHRNRAGLTSDERNDTMYSEKSFKEVGKALREEQTVNNPTERNTRLRPRGLGRQALSTRQSSGEQSTGQATASSARLQLTFDTLDAIKGVWSMGESKIAYGECGWTGKEMLTHDKKHNNYFGDYALPDDVKEVILDCLQDAIAEVQYDTGHDYEGNSYNSLKYKPIPEKGLWIGARKAA